MLLELLTFRHAMRSLYALEVDVSKIAATASEFAAVHAALVEEHGAFADVLDAAGME